MPLTNRVARSLALGLGHFFTMDKLGFTFYPKDWWTSETFFEFTPEQRYIYLECLFVMYSNDGYMKTQKTQLENRLRTQISDEVWEIITEKFIRDDNGFTHASVNKRLRKTIANRENGQKGGRPKKDIEKTQITQNENPKKPTLEREREREIETKKESIVSGDKSPSLPKSNLKETLPIREKAFYQNLVPYAELYPKEMLREFFNYWSEKNKSETKMKWELERTFEIPKRLTTWAKRESNFKNSNQKNQTNEPPPPIRMGKREAEALGLIPKNDNDDPNA